ncbi:MAG: dTDP-4-dehydrorhamnose reductase [Deltaproteobacteria bacterium]|nr:dTDP-4-dehydrorhamnose reductase [Deltaproteobacteria bacterium]
MTATATAPTAWVPGARGMLGQEVVAILRERGVAHVATDRELDIGDAAAVDAFAADHLFTHVINCAAYTAVDACETHEPLAAHINALGPANLARVARERGAIAVHVSTDYVFDGQGAAPYREDDPTGPENAYGRTKLAGEERFLAAAGERGYVVRTSWLFGPGGPNFVATMLRLLRANPEVRVVHDQTGRPTYAPDLALALVDLALAAPAVASGVYHFANAGAVTWFELASAARELAIARGLPIVGALTPITTAEYPTPARRPRWSVLATDKITAALGRAPRPWADGLAAYLDALATTQAPRD